MKIKVKLTIGYPGAIREDVIKVEDSDIEDMTEEEKASYLQEITEEWANNYIGYWYEEV